MNAKREAPKVERSRVEAAPDEASEPIETEILDAEVVEEDPAAEQVGDAEVVDDEPDGDQQAPAEAGSGDPAGDQQAPAEADFEEEVDAAPDPLAEALRERDEYLGLAQRARADFENFRKRAGAQAAEAEGRGRATLARGLLPAIDNLQRALTAAGVDPADPDASGDGLAKGVALVYGELRAALERGGVIAFDPLGERFDPNMHEAISTAPGGEGGSGIVVETLEHGYRVEAQVIRPARVVVSA